MAIRTINAPQGLEGVVRRFWYTDPHVSYNDLQSIRILADGAPGIIFQHSNGHSAVMDTTGSPLPVAFVYGQSTSPCVNQMLTSPFVFGVDLSPAALKRVFGLDAYILTNAIVGLECLVDRWVIDELLNANNLIGLIHIFTRLLSQRLSRRDADTLIEESVRRIVRDTPELSSSNMASLFNISPRQFQRRFKDHIGVCPETYIRIIKFQKSIHMLQSQHYQKLSDISYSLGYTDQSYFNREFKLFSGYTPKEFLKTITTPQRFYHRSGQSMTPVRILSD